VLFKGIKKWSPPFRATTIHIQNEKAELASGLSFRRPKDQFETSTSLSLTNEIRRDKDCRL
jgi:hypothetical protein